MKKTRRLVVLAFLIFNFVASVRAMTLNITYDPSVTNLGYSATAPPAVAFAVQWFQRQYTNPITINIIVAFDPAVGLGQSNFNLTGKTYAQVTNALNSRRVSAADFSSVASLPANDPIGPGTQWWVPRAEAKALGLVSANDSSNDGTVTFASTVNYTFDPNNRAVAGKYDFIGVVEHEISEVMGRVYLLGDVGGYAPYDLFRFTNNAARSFDQNVSNAYFSVDNGATVQKYFYTNANFGDLQDWITSTPADSFDAFLSSGRQAGISAADILSLDILGYNMPNVTPPVLTGTRLANGSFKISFNSIALTNFTVLANTNLATTNWTVLGTATESSAGLYLFTNAPTAGVTQRFYRVRSP